MRVGTEQVGDAGEDTDRLEGVGLRRAAATCDRGISVRPDDGDVFDFRGIERQQIPLVLEQRNAFESALKSDCAIGDRVSGVGGIELRTICPAVAQLGAEEPEEMVVDGGFSYLTNLNGRNKILRIHEFRAGHFEIEAVIDRGNSVVGCVPVGHENALKTPFTLEQFDVEKVILRGVNPVHLVVGIHHRVHVSLGDGGLKGRQIDLAHGALVDVDARVVAIELLIVEGEVLHCSGNALRLHAFNKWDHEGSVQKRIFGKVFKIAPAKRRARDVYAGTEKEVDAAGAGVASQAFADLPGELGIPAGGKRNAACIGRRRSPGAHAKRSIGHFEAWQADDGHGASEHAVDAAEELDLLVERELGDHRLSLSFDGGRIGSRSLGRNGEAACEKNCENEREWREK